jgi:hypothetical protein
MNTIGSAWLHVARTAGVNPGSAASQPEGLGLSLAAWLSRAFGRLAGALGRIGHRPVRC